MSNKLKWQEKKIFLMVLVIVTIISINFVLIVKYRELASENKELEIDYFQTRYELIARKYAPMTHTEFGMQVYGGYQFLFYNGELTIDELDERLRQASEVMENEKGTVD